MTQELTAVKIEQFCKYRHENSQRQQQQQQQRQQQQRQQQRRHRRISISMLRQVTTIQQTQS